MRVTPWGPVGRNLRLILVGLGIFVLLIFVVDRLVLRPAPAPPPLTTTELLQRLANHQVRRVTIAARSVTVELADGETLETVLDPDRDLGPALVRSHTDVAVVRPTNRQRSEESQPTLLTYIVQFIPFIVMSLLLVYILRVARGRQY